MLVSMSESYRALPVFLTLDIATPFANRNENVNFWHVSEELGSDDRSVFDTTAGIKREDSTSYRSRIQLAMHPVTRPAFEVHGLQIASIDTSQRYSTLQFRPPSLFVHQICTSQNSLQLFHGSPGFA